MNSGIPAYMKIKRHMSRPDVKFHDHSLATIVVGKHKVYISKTSLKFRLKSFIDWAHYEPKDLAQAIDSNSVDLYYERQLRDSLSDPNVWKRRQEEMEVKSYYAARSGRASLI